jgi:hypothetical protein
MTKFASTRTLAVVAVCSVLTACEDHNWQDGLRGRSDKFVYRDINRDDRITRPEWERRYGTVVNDPMVVWFDELDCDGDGVVTWSEYYHNLFLRDPCPSRSGPFPSGFRDDDLRSRNNLGAVTLCDTDSDFQRGIRSHREEGLTQAEIEAVEIECAAPVRGKPPYIGDVMGRCSVGDSKKQAYYSKVSIRNKNVDATISTVTLSVALTSAESAKPNGLKHLKTVSLPPNSVQVVTAWFSIDGTELADAQEETSSECELHSALGY